MLMGRPIRDGLSSTTLIGKNSMDDPADDLGPVLVESHPPNQDVRTLVILGTLALIIGAGGGSSGQFSPIAYGLLLGVGALLVGGDIWLKWSQRGLTLDLHERGISRTVAGEMTDSFPFEDADRIAFACVRQLIHGVRYRETVETLRLTREGPPEATLEFVRHFDERKVGQGQTDGERLVRPIFARIARQMSAKLAKGEAVTWYPGATIRPWGIELPTGWGGTREVHWAELMPPEMVQGFCKLTLVGSKSPIATVNSFQPNFFPGLEIVAARAAGK
jgi:hypothetical protein